MAASNRRGSKFPAGRNKVDPSPYPPPRGGGWLVETEGPAPAPLSLPLERGGGAQRRRGSARQLPPSVEPITPKLRPLDSALPKGGGSLVSTHAALSPELGSMLKVQSGCKSGTTAPGVQGAGRGPRRFLWLLSCPRKKVTRLSGRDPTTPPAGCRKIPRRGDPSSRGSQPAGIPENPRRGNPLKTTGGSRETDS